MKGEKARMKEERERFSILKAAAGECVFAVDDVIGSSGTSVQELIDNAT